MILPLRPKNIVRRNQQSEYPVPGLAENLSGDEESFRMMTSEVHCKPITKEDLVW